MPITDDITRLRKSSSDDVIFQHFYSQDAGFKTAVDRVKTANPTMGALEEANFPKAMLNIYYKVPHPKQSSPLTTQMTSALGESSVVGPSAEQHRGLLDPYTVESQQGKGWQAVAAGGANILKSAGRMAVGLGEAAIHPFQTIGNVGKLAVGGSANTVETIAGLFGDKNAEQIFNAPGEEIASKVGQFYKSRYDSPDHILKTLYEDPVGFLADLATVVSGGGAIMKGIGKIGEIGTAAATAGAESIPLDSMAAKAGQFSESMGNAGSSMIEAGNAIDPALATMRGVGGLAKSVLGRYSPEKLVSSSLKINPSDVRTIVKPNVAGMKPEKWLLDNGLIDKTGETADSLMNKLDDFSTNAEIARDAGLAGVTKKYALADPTELVAKAGDAADNIPLNQLSPQGMADAAAGAVTEPVKVFSRVGDALDELQKLFDGTIGNEDVLAQIDALKNKGVLSLEDIQSVKQMMDKYMQIYSNSGDVKAGAMAAGLKNVRADIQHFIENEAADSGFKDIASLNKKIQVAHEIRDAINKVALRQGSNNILSLTDLIVGSVAGASGGLHVGVGLVLAKHIVSSQRFKTAVASILYSLSPAQIQVLEKGLTGANRTTEAMNMVKEILNNAALIESSLRANEQSK